MQVVEGNGLSDPSSDLNEAVYISHRDNMNLALLPSAVGRE